MSPTSSRRRTRTSRLPRQRHAAHRERRDGHLVADPDAQREVPDPLVGPTTPRTSATGTVASHSMDRPRWRTGEIGTTRWRCDPRAVRVRASSAEPAGTRASWLRVIARTVSAGPSTATARGDRLQVQPRERPVGQAEVGDVERVPTLGGVEVPLAPEHPVVVGDQVDRQPMALVEPGRDRQHAVEVVDPHQVGRHPQHRPGLVARRGGEPLCSLVGALECGTSRTLVIIDSKERFSPILIPLTISTGSSSEHTAR